MSLPVDVQLVIVWGVGIAFGYFLAWRRFNGAYVMIDKEKLKKSNQELATQHPASNPRCACCKETKRNEDNTSFTCPCAWSAKDLLDEYNHICTLHRNRDDRKQAEG